MADDLLNAHRRKQAAYEAAGLDDLAKAQAKAIAKLEKKPDSDPIDAYHVGGGWYEIDGEKVQGKDAAREALGG